MIERRQTIWIIILLGLALTLAFLAACAGAPTTQQPVATQAPAEVQPTSVPPTPAPTRPLFPTPALVSPTPQVEARLVELEWPAQLRLGDSDVVRLALIPVAEGYQVRVDFPEHQTDTQEVPVQRVGGYDLWAVARLDGVGFDVSPQDEQVSALPEGEAVTWHWTLQPRPRGSSAYRSSCCCVGCPRQKLPDQHARSRFTRAVWT